MSFFLFFHHSAHCIKSHFSSSSFSVAPPKRPLLNLGKKRRGRAFCLHFSLVYCLFYQQVLMGLAVLYAAASTGQILCVRILSTQLSHQLDLRLDWACTNSHAGLSKKIDRAFFLLHPVSKSLVINLIGHQIHWLLGLALWIQARSLQIQRLLELVTAVTLNMTAVNTPDVYRPVKPTDVT
uniref:Uncharacterized protein n=1 Tax=Ditylenchus dipsaci TaxID=166011 RepID=A0A915EEK0_9BILA